MKTFVIEEKFVGYADITIEAETEEEAIALYNRGDYPDSNYQRDDMFYDFQLIIINKLRFIPFKPNFIISPGYFRYIVIIKKSS